MLAILKELKLFEIANSVTDAILCALPTQSQSSTSLQLSVNAAAYDKLRGLINLLSSLHGVRLPRLLNIIQEKVTKVFQNSIMPNLSLPSPPVVIEEEQDNDHEAERLLLLHTC